MACSSEKVAPVFAGWGGQVTTPSPSMVELDGGHYQIGENSYKEWVESSYQAQPGIAGSSRPAENPRPDVRTWRLDDWSAGEGHKFYVSEQGHPSQRGYFTSTLAAGVDVLPAGQVRLGLVAATTLSIAAGTTGPYLAVANGTVWVAYDSTTKELTTLAATIAGDVWTARTSGMNAQVIRGVHSGVGHMNAIWLAGDRSAGDGGVRRVTSSGSTQWVAESAWSPCPANNRIYYSTRGTDTSTLKQSGLDAAAAGTTVVTFNGVGSTPGGWTRQNIAVGSKIYTLLWNSGLESPRLWEYDGNAGREVAVFEGFRIDNTGLQTYTAPMCVVDGVLFLAGYDRSPQMGGNQIPRLDYFDGERIGTALRLERRLDTDVANTATATPTSGLRFMGCAAGDEHSVVLTDEENGIWRYSLLTGGIWRLGVSTTTGAGGAVLEHNGSIFYAAQPGVGGVDRTLVSGSGKYPASASLWGPFWDFDLPDTEKILTEIELQANLPANTSIEVAFILDNDTVITTDAAGATMSMTVTGRKKFTISGASVERNFRFLMPKIILKTSDTSATPVLYSMTLRCIPVPNVVRFFEFDIDLQDETASDRKTGQQLTGAKQRALLDALRDSTSNRLFTFTPLYLSTGSPYPGPSGTQHTVMLAANTQNGIFESSDRGEGRMRLRLMKVGA